MDSEFNHSDEPWRLSDREIQHLRESTKPPQNPDDRIAAWQAKVKWAWEVTHVPERFRSEFGPLLDSLSGVPPEDESRSFYNAASAIGDFISRLNGPSRWRISEDLADEFTKCLAQAYRRRPAKDVWGRLAVLRLVANHGRSKECKELILEGLRSEDKSIRDAVIGELFSKPLEDDGPIFDAVLTAYKMDGPSHANALACLRRLNPERALPVLMDALSQSTKELDFVRISKGLCSYHRIELIEPILVALTTKFKGDVGSGLEPGRGLDADLLLEYIAKTDGEGLELALKSLSMNPPAIWRSGTAIIGKLNSSIPRSRIAVLRFLDDAILHGNFINEQTREALVAFMHGEKDPQILEEAKRVFKKLESQMGRGSA